MKKTLIALLAMFSGGYAMGEQTTIDFTFSSPSGVITFDNISLAQDWTLSFSLMVTPTNGFNNYGTPILSTENDPFTATQKLQVYAGIAGNSIVVKPNRGDDSCKSTLNTDVQDEWKATSYKEFELSYDLETTTLTVNVTDAAGTSILDADWSGVTFDNCYLSQLKTGISQNMLNSQQWSLPTGSFTYGSIPEPTTATLSLLALAGLAARRRRR